MGEMRLLGTEDDKKESWNTITVRWKATSLMSLAMAMMRPDVKSHLPERAKTRRNKRGQKFSTRNGGATDYIGKRTTNAQMPGHPVFSGGAGAGAPHLGVPNVPGEGRQSLS